MKRKTVIRHLVATFLLLVIALAFFELTNVDLWLQDHFYLKDQKRWLVDAQDPVWRFLFYDGLKGAIILFGAANAIAYIAALRRDKLRPFRKRFCMLFLALAFVPLIVAGSKAFTNVYCPAQLERYGGDKPYVRVLESYPKGFHQTERGRCFPAGHATGGFSLMMLYFVFDHKRYRQIGLSAGLVLGWAMGIYQMVKGAHFLSHTVITMIASWIIILLIYIWFGCEDNNEDKGAVSSL